jgi:hypothetical protein
MTQNHTQAQTGALKVEVALRTTDFGTRTPQFEVTVPKAWGFRSMHAALYGLAMKLELATPRRESWVVEVARDGDCHGRVHLELLNANDREVEAAMALLRTIAAEPCTMFPRLK